VHPCASVVTQYQSVTDGLMERPPAAKTLVRYADAFKN